MKNFELPAADNGNPFYTSAPIVPFEGDATDVVCHELGHRLLTDVPSDPEAQRRFISELEEDFPELAAAMAEGSRILTDIFPEADALRDMQNPTSGN